MTNATNRKLKKPRLSLKGVKRDLKVTNVEDMDSGGEVTKEDGSIVGSISSMNMRVMNMADYYEKADDSETQLQRMSSKLKFGDAPVLLNRNSLPPQINKDNSMLSVSKQANAFRR